MFGNCLLKSSSSSASTHKHQKHHCQSSLPRHNSSLNHQLTTTYNHPQTTPTSFKMLPIVKSAAAPKVVPVLLTIGSATIVGSYVRSQLKTQSRTFDRQFSQYNTKESEAVRAKTFDGKVPDPRTSFFNILGW
ncbi:hypothetical protein B0J15DRAFT_473636, partial [Fusarium solani]